MERREDGVLFVCMHTLGGEVQWNAQLHRAIWQLFRTIGSDPENEVLIFTAKGGNWMRGFDTESWAEIEEPAAGGDQKRATYENMFYDGRNMLISLVHDVEFPTICAFPGFGFHAEIGLMMDIAIASDDAIILAFTAASWNWRACAAVHTPCGWVNRSMPRRRWTGA
jgi:enoyl-CoA hydratase/carnithine racemase